MPPKCDVEVTFNVAMFPVIDTLLSVDVPVTINVPVISVLPATERSSKPMESKTILPETVKSPAIVWFPYTARLPPTYVFEVTLRVATL